MDFLKTKSILSFILLTTFSTSALAETLTWKECVVEASRHNPDILASHSRVQSSTYQVRASGSDFFPQVTVSAGYDKGNASSSTSSSVTASAAEFGSGSGTRDTLASSVTVTQNVFSGFERIGRVKQAKANRLATQWDLSGVKAQVSHDLKSAFAELVFSQRLLNLSNSIIQRRRQNLNNVQLRYEGGNENKGSALLSSASLESALFERQQAENAIRVSRQRLARVLGRDTLAGLAVSGGIPMTKPIQPSDWEKLALSSPEVGRADAETKAAQAAVTIASSGFYPRVDVVATASQRDRERVDDRMNWATGVDLTFPIFQGFSTYYNTRSAQADRLAARYNKTSVKQQKLVGLQDTFTTYMESVRQVHVAKRFLEAARTRAEIAESRYNNGLLTFEDWDIIENDLINRERAVLQSERDRVLAEAAWELEQGKGVIP